MRYLILFLLGLFLSHHSHAQIYEVGVYGGGSNFIGDIGSTAYIAPNAPALGIIGKWNRSPRHSWRISLIYSDLKAFDSESDDPRRRERNYKFDSNILEISTGIEYTFWEFDLHKSKTEIVPYIYSGISIANYDNYYVNTAGAYIAENTDSWAYGIPMVLGVKSNVLNNFILAFEIGARYTFSDEIDGSLPDAKDLEVFSFGNTNSNDWYVFTGFTLTYTFGQRPCYCNF